MHDLQVFTAKINLRLVDSTNLAIKNQRYNILPPMSIIYLHKKFKEKI